MAKSEAEKRYSSSDIPDFSTYPSTPPQIPREMAIGAKYSRTDSELEERARKIGWALGQLVNKLDDVRKQAQDRINYKQQEDAQDRIDIARQKAQQKFSDARTKAAELRRRAINDYPVQVILAAGVVGFLAGAGLRLWRENRG
jgi:hypothetical protein